MVEEIYPMNADYIKACVACERQAKAGVDLQRRIARRAQPDAAISGYEGSRKLWECLNGVLFLALCLLGEEVELGTIFRYTL
jgi:hypothetical protein